MQMKRKIIFFGYGVLLAAIWGHCFLDLKADSYTAALGLSFTFLSAYFLQKEYNFELSFPDKLCILAFPLFCLVILYYNNYAHGLLTEAQKSWFFVLFYFQIINPHFVATVVLLLALTKLKYLSKPVNIFIFTFITLFYSYSFHPNWKTRQFVSLTENFDDSAGKNDESQKDTETYEVDYDVNLSKFAFINPDFDTVQLIGTSDKFILLETWNETCFPCIKAMQELPGFYNSIENKVEAYYLYESNKEHVRRKFDKIFAFKSIENKSKILIDIDQGLYSALKMSGYPYFLLFDSHGKLIYHSRGYIGKDALSKEIRKHIGG